MRKLFSCLLALVLTIGVTGTIITPASATSRPELVENDYFYVYKGGGPAVSDKFMRKTDYSDSMYTEIETNLLSGCPLKFYTGVAVLKPWQGQQNWVQLINLLGVA